MKRPRRHAGFTLIELMISVTLIALLLTSIAVAMHASLTSYNQNETAAGQTHAVRLLMMRMQQDIRSAEAVDYEADYDELVIYPPPNDRGIDEIRYEHDWANGQLLYHRVSGDETTTAVLLDQDSLVQPEWMYVHYDVVRNPQGVYCTRRACVNLGVQEGGTWRTITFSAAPRRNLSF